MASFKFAVSVLAMTALPVTNGFTSRALSTRSARRLQATDESFQRSLLEARLANESAPAVVDETAVNGDEGSSVSSPPAVPDLASIQNSILRIAASTDRGQFAKPFQKDDASRLIGDLESNAPEIESALKGSAGTWELLYSNTQLFRSSPFFLAGRSTCKTPEQAQQYGWFCDMHRAALAISTIGVVRQVITGEGRLVNEFEVKVGAVPFLSDFLPLAYSGGLPFTIDGAIVSTADATQTATDEWELYMDTVEIKGSNIPVLRNVLDSGNAKLKSRDLSDFLKENVESYETPRPVLRTTYLDDSMRIVRDVDDNVFVYGRASRSEEATDYSAVLADLGVASLLEGFNDAVAKIYL
eukprot:CAMPEP_0172531128 /NCGR_PEP_ID=MMETSP1067-20121228/4653_1 /TAXON_ID=265564 ORGANISM="Thalassiosira punctigera, Strain Tpunct2005C2" /NCGR_SAMPLE_ID=MMETSP1067 /ASSEMBLY_ACC=CAM_ASM_000444 /LENGTH=354 /DNA_ID=CAMNT_0013315471 /DNA_START=64 /DNA_END=1128 /DNA_ORIENTATION=-